MKIQRFIGSIALNEGVSLEHNAVHAVIDGHDVFRNEDLFQFRGFGEAVYARYFDTVNLFGHDEVFLLLPLFGESENKGLFRLSVSHDLIRKITAFVRLLRARAQ